MRRGEELRRRRDAEMKVGSSEGMKGRKKRWGVGSEKGRGVEKEKR